MGRGLLLLNVLGHIKVIRRRLGLEGHMKLGNIDFKTYMCMKGMSKEEFDVLNKQSEEV